MLLLLAGCASPDAANTRASDEVDAAGRASAEALDQSLLLADVELELVRVHGRTPLQEATASTSGSALLLAVNAGFFDEDVRPLGLATSRGHSFAALDRAMGGGVLWVAGGVGHLDAAEEYRETAVDLALQSRPRLVVGRQNNIRRDDGIAAARTALCLRQGGTELVVVRRVTQDGSGPTLYALARELVAMGCEDALNLDGGPSVAWAAHDGPWLEPKTPIAMVLVAARKPSPVGR
jgi:uncharacterized protein YigE (DUF2233 family)